MDLSDVAEKIANQARLTPEEKDFWKRSMRETQLRNSFVAGNTTPSNTLGIDLPFYPIYSEVIQTDKASIDIPIPSGYKHLFIMGSGKDSDGDATSNLLFGRFNGDSGTNYSQQKLLMNGASATASSFGSQTGAIVGELKNSGDATPRSASFFCVIPHYSSSYYKAAIMLSIGNGTSLIFSYWDNVTPIEKITLLDTNLGVNISAGTSISVYGLR